MSTTASLTAPHSSHSGRLARSPAYAMATCWILVAFFFTYVKASGDQSAEVQLKTYLKARSDLWSHSRPVLDPANNVTVYFGLRLIQVEIDEKANQMRTSVWVRQKWRDEFMTWNASEFGGIRRISIPADWVWTPDVNLVNTGSTEDKTRVAEIRLSNDGGVFWLLHRYYNSACLVNIRDYPFDQQTCHLWFQSLSNPSLSMDLHSYSPGFDLDTYLSDFQEADEWRVISNDSVRVRSPRELGELLMFSRRVTLRVTLTLRRRAGFQAYLLSVPCVVLGAMSVLVFVLPPERPDRHAIGTTLLGSFVLLLLILVQTAPPSAASVPKLGLLYAANIGVIIISLTLSAIVVNVSKRGDRGIRFPSFMEKPLSVLGFMFFIRTPRMPKADPLVKRDVSLTSPSMAMAANGRGDGDSGHLFGQLQVMENKMTHIEHTLNRLLEVMSRPPRKGPIDAARWRALAAIFDRLFLTVQCILIVVTITLLFPRENY